jgi:hypothetical protein
MSSELLSWKDLRLCQRLFLHLLRGSCSFCPCFCLSAVLHFWIYICWTILVSLDETDLGVVYDLFDMLLNSVCQYLVENLCIYIH